MQTINIQPVLRKEDYQIMIAYLRGSVGRSSFDRYNAEDLEIELKKAKLVNREEFPRDVVGLNSLVTIKAEGEDKVMELMLVIPDKADIKQRKISVMSPIGTALIGFAKGQKVSWKVPSGNKTFVIMEVLNPME